MDMITIDHFSKICRGCLVPATSGALQMVEISTEYLEDLFGEGRDLIGPESSALPQQMCSGCYKKCEKWRTWRMQFADNQHILQSVFERDCKQEYIEQDDGLEISNSDRKESVDEAENEFSVVEILSCDGMSPENDAIHESDPSYQEDALLEINEEQVAKRTRRSQKIKRFEILSSQSLSIVDEVVDEYDRSYHEMEDTSPVVKRPRKSPKKKLFEMEVAETPQELPDTFDMIYIECAFCKTDQGFCEDYNKHLVENHLEEDKHTFTCTLCENGSKFDTQNSLIKHLYSHTKIRFRCPVCPVVLLSRQTLSSHLRAQHKSTSNLSMRQCHICGCHCDDEKALLTHFEDFHVAEGDRECFMCPEDFDTRSKLVKHYYTHAYSHPYAVGKSLCCEICGEKYLTDRALQNHLESHGPEKERYECDVCGNTYKHRYYLTKHKERHTMEKTIQCPECGKYYYTKRDLDTHMKTHTESEKYVCSYCERGFLNSSVLKEHMRIRHTLERLFPCNQCDRSYYRKRELEEHQRSHTGERPFSCEICQRTYARKTTLMTHMKTHKEEVVDGKEEKVSIPK